ncbi:FadR family transcriptional regulator [Baekduia soli]|uniref:FadR family transcriptional regulator n=1 Tax=Baekduia soli TaxID=496014 RepID=A0A5B8U5F6_9ACTN|nr:FadR/GntR family transcriptional regulator [Baekduia soli]QEC48359.1 FadR family transcriptional regulator [Baekduia soli]
MGRVPHVEVQRVRVPKASDVFAAELRGRILDGDLEPGVALPNERALAEAAGLSRTVVREALRILEIEGLVVTRPGRGGGTVVDRPDPQSLTRSVDIFIRGRGVRFRELLEAREQIEPACAELAARHRTDDDLRALDAATEAVRAVAAEVPAFLTANAAWHVTVARISHNELLASFMRALSDAVRAATDIADFNSDEVRAGALRAHDRVARAIRDGDGGAARAAMAHHVGAYREQVLKYPVPEELGLEHEREERQ